MSRYDYQGELQNELTEKLEIAIENVTKSKRKMLAQDVYDLLSISVHSTDLTSEEKWELINSRMGQYLNSYVDSEEKFSEHVMKELDVVRKPLLKSQA